MARTWLQIRVELEGGRDIDCDPRPGRVFIVGPSHTFADLATAIDAAFARWDLSHLHLFELPDGRQIGYPDPDFEQNWLDHAALKVARGSRRATSSPTRSTSATTGATTAGCSPRRPTPSRSTATVRGSRCRSGAGAGSPTSTAARPSRTTSSGRRLSRRRASYPANQGVDVARIRPLGRQRHRDPALRPISQRALTIVSPTTRPWSLNRTPCPSSLASNAAPRPGSPQRR